MAGVAGVARVVAVKAAVATWDPSIGRSSLEVMGAGAGPRLGRK